VKRILQPAIYVVAAIYFLVDVVFMAVARPIADWFARHWVFVRLRKWIASLSPYPALALFAVPVVLLEPVKPVAAYLVATGHILAGIISLIIGELLKLVCVERLFCVTKHKLLSIPAFAWGYARYRRVKDWVEASEVWRNCRRLSKSAVDAVRHYVIELRRGSTRRASWQSR
jgi:1-acyl-sn-glycerol-3-phosphate acyltransferase